MLIEYLREEAAELQNSVPDDSSDSNESLQQKIEPEFKANNSTEGQRMHRADVEGGSARLREREVRHTSYTQDYKAKCAAKRRPTITFDVGNHSQFFTHLAHPVLPLSTYPVVKGRCLSAAVMPHTVPKATAWMKTIATCMHTYM